LDDVRALIEAARQHVARTVNGTMVVLYWGIGKRIREDILHQERAEYGRQIVSTLSKRLTLEYGRGFTRTNLFYMMQFAEVFPDEQIVHALRGQLALPHSREYCLDSRRSWPIWGRSQAIDRFIREGENAVCRDVHDGIVTTATTN
jgi:hypothetical protein